MAEASKVPAKTEKTPSRAPQVWRPFESFRREIDRIFDEFDGGYSRAPLRRFESPFETMPAM